MQLSAAGPYQSYLAENRLEGGAAVGGGSRPRAAEMDKRTPTTQPSTPSPTSPLFPASPQHLHSNPYPEAAVSPNSLPTGVETGEAKAVELSPPRAKPRIRLVKPKEDAWVMVDGDGVEREEWHMAETEGMSGWEVR